MKDVTSNDLQQNQAMLKDVISRADQKSLAYMGTYALSYLEHTLPTDDFAHFLKDADEAAQQTLGAQQREPQGTT